MDMLDEWMDVLSRQIEVCIIAYLNESNVIESLDTVEVKGMKAMCSPTSTLDPARMMSPDAFGVGE